MDPRAHHTERTLSIGKYFPLKISSAVFPLQCFFGSSPDGSFFSNLSRVLGGRGGVVAAHGGRLNPEVFLHATWERPPALMAVAWKNFWMSRGSASIFEFFSDYNPERFFETLRIGKYLCLKFSSAVCPLLCFFSSSPDGSFLSNVYRAPGDAAASIAVL